MATKAKTGGWWVRYTWLWLALLVPLLVLSNGRWQLSIATLASLFLTRLFLMSQPVARGLLILLPVQLAAYFIMWWEVIPAPGVLYYIIAASYGLCYLLPFVADRLVATRVTGFTGTLVLPLAWYLVEILIQLLTPYGSWTSVGYTQMGHGLLTPLAAWAGVAGVAFATVWLASVASWLVIAPTAMRSRAFVTALFAGSMAVLVWLAQTTLPDETRVASSVQMAAITPSDEGTRALSREVQRAMQSGDSSPAFLAHIDDLTSQLNEDLLVRSRDAALSGARLVVWSETAGHILDSTEEELIVRAQALAREHSIYLFMGLGVWHPGGQPPLENKVIAITPSGEIAWQNQKARPIVGAEAHLLPPGHDNLATLDTPFGRIGLVICHDLDFADYVAQAGRANVDLLLAPSADWPAIADLHARMGIMRAVENGFWLLRPAYDGLSVVASPEGHVIHSAYDAQLEERVFAGQIPVMRKRTIFPYIGAWLPFVATVLLVGMLVLAWRDDPS